MVNCMGWESSRQGVPLSLKTSSLVLLSWIWIILSHSAIAFCASFCSSSSSADRMPNLSSLTMASETSARYTSNSALSKEWGQAPCGSEAQSACTFVPPGTFSTRSSILGRSSRSPQPISRPPSTPPSPPHVPALGPPGGRGSPC